MSVKELKKRIKDLRRLDKKIEACIDSARMYGEMSEYQGGRWDNAQKGNDRKK